MSPPSHDPDLQGGRPDPAARGAPSAGDRSRVLPVLPIPSVCAVRDTVVSDLPATARLHVRELPVGLFPRLGRRFVRRWHRAFLRSPHAVSLTAVRVDAYGVEQIAGFLIGATDREAFMQELLSRHRTALLTSGTLALALRPWVLGRFLRTRLRPYLRRLRRIEVVSRRDAPLTTGERVRTPIGELTAVAIMPTLRGSGAGRLLVAEFLARCSTAGTPTAELVTVSGPTGASSFYVHMGWTAIGQDVTRDGLRVERFSRRTDEVEGG
jgi:GNAT superfamily N-acetyltransferase